MAFNRQGAWLRSGVFGAIAIVSFGAGVAMSRSSLGRFLELKSYDFRFALRGARDYTPLPITILGIDELALSRNPEPLMLWHRHFATVVNGLARAGATVVAIDFMFSDISQFDPAGQQAFSEAIINAGAAGMPLVLGYRISDNGVQQPPDSIRMPAIAMEHPFAFLNLTTDIDDFVRRQKVSTTDSNGSPQPGMALAVADAFVAKNGGPGRTAGGMDTVLINFRPPRHFQRESFGRALEASQSGDEEYLKRAFGGRIVLIARMGEKGEEDLHSTPHYYWRAQLPPELSRRTPGIEIHANAISTLLADGPIRQLGPSTQYLIDASTVLLITVGCVFWRPGRATAAAGIVLVLVLYYGIFRTFEQNIWMEVVSSAAAGTVAFGMSQTANYFLEGRERRRIRNMFGRYVNDNVIEKILLDSDKVLLHGTRKPVAVMFADIRNFTTLSEAAAAEDIVRMLNIYFTGVIGTIQRHSGMVNSLMGDGLMAIFGAPLDDSRAARNAIAAAREMLRALEDVNAQLNALGLLRKLDRKAIEIGIGIHYGEAVVGNMGSPRKMEYTAIGDIVNTASRIEGLTRKTGAEILITRETFVAAGEPAEAAYVGEFEVKGRTGLVSLFRI